MYFGLLGSDILFDPKTFLMIIRSGFTITCWS